MKIVIFIPHRNFDMWHESRPGTFYDITKSYNHIESLCFCLLQNIFNGQKLSWLGFRGGGGNCILIDFRILSLTFNHERDMWRSIINNWHILFELSSGFSGYLNTKVAFFMEMT